jgi:hypothetical protein
MNSAYPLKDEGQPVRQHIPGALAFLALGALAFHVATLSFRKHDATFNAPVKVLRLPSHEEVEFELQSQADRNGTDDRIVLDGAPFTVFEFLMAQHPTAKTEQVENAHDCFWLHLDHDDSMIVAFSEAEKEIVKCPKEHTP